MRTLAVTILAVTLLLSCDRADPTASAAKAAKGTTGNKVRVGYVGLTCEAPLFSAYEQGFFKEEGVEVEMVKCDWATYKDALALGHYDVTHTLVMYLLKPIEQGLNVRMTAGVHRGCLRVQTLKDSPIKTVADMRGKRVGVPAMGTPPFIFASRVFGAAGIDVSKEITWRVYPSAELGLALDSGKVDAVANAEPIGSLLLAQGKVRNVVDQVEDPPYRDEYCCAVACNGKFITDNPQVAAKVTRAILKGAKWVGANQLAAAKLSVEKKYLAANPELNAQALMKLAYIPSVSGGERAVALAAEEMQKARILNPSTDLAELAKRGFVHLEGVTDEWVESVAVETVPGGQPSPMPIDELARLVAGEERLPSCCMPAKTGKVRMPNEDVETVRAGH